MESKARFFDRGSITKSGWRGLDAIRECFHSQKLTAKKTPPENSLRAQQRPQNETRIRIPTIQGFRCELPCCYQNRVCHVSKIFQQLSSELQISSEKFLLPPVWLGPVIYFGAGRCRKMLLRGTKRAVWQRVWRRERLSRVHSHILQSHPCISTPNIPSPASQGKKRQLLAALPRW